MILVTSYVLVLLYSPISPYFAGTSIEARSNLEQCVLEAHGRLGEDLKLGHIGWEKEMMGPLPKVIAAYCAEGAVQ